MVEEGGGNRAALAGELGKPATIHAPCGESNMLMPLLSSGGRRVIPSATLEVHREKEASGEDERRRQEERGM